VNNDDSGNCVAVAVC